MSENSLKIAINENLWKLRQGESSALTLLYENSSRQLYVLCYSYLKNRYDSEDALTDTYITIKKEIDKFNGKNGFAWIYTIAKNICLNKIKRAKYTVLCDFEDEKTINALEDKNREELVAEDESGIIQIAKEVLRKEEFRILILHAVSDYSFKDIGKIVSAPEATVRWQYHNCLKKVRKEYERRNLNEE